MASGRMLRRNITESQKIAKVNDRARAIYMMLLPFTDKAGRLKGHPLFLKGAIFLKLEYDLDDIQESVRDLVDAGLLEAYCTGEGDEVLQFTNFEEHNKPDGRESESGFAGPDDSGSEPSRLYSREAHEHHAKSPRKPHVEPVGTPRKTRGDPAGNSQGHLEEVPRSSCETPAGKRAVEPHPKNPKNGRNGVPDDTHVNSAEFTRKPHVNSASELEVELEVQLEVEVELEGEGEGGVGEGGKHPSSEETHAHALATGKNSIFEKNRVRGTLRRLAGRRFVERFEPDLQRWSQYSDGELERLWDLAHPSNWRGLLQERKKRSWIFEDLLNDELLPPTHHGRSTADRAAEILRNLGGEPETIDVTPTIRGVLDA